MQDRAARRSADKPVASHNEQETIASFPSLGSCHEQGARREPQWLTWVMTDCTESLSAVSPSARNICHVSCEATAAVTTSASAAGNQVAQSTRRASWWRSKARASAIHVAERKKGKKEKRKKKAKKRNISFVSITLLRALSNVFLSFFLSFFIYLFIYLCILLFIIHRTMADKICSYFTVLRQPRTFSPQRSGLCTKKRLPAAAAAAA
jgi:hypothetical protein